MPANVDFDPPAIPPYADSVPILVYRYDAEADEDDRIQAMPNVYCLGISRNEGPDPGSARFEYVFNDTDPTSPYPSQFQDVWPLTAQGRWVVVNDDRLVVVAVTSTGFHRVLFDGFAEIPQVNVTPASQSVTFSAVGVAVRAWDSPIGGAVYRRADDPDSESAHDQIPTDLSTRFNPMGRTEGSGLQPNCTPDDHDFGDAATGFPVFLDHRIVRDPDPRTFWTIGRAVRYLLGVCNLQGNPTWVTNPDFTNIDTVLKARTPKDGDEFYDPGDSTTYTSSDIVVRDYDATNKTWPEAVAELCGFAGAVIRFELTQDSNGDPVTTLRCRRGDATRSSAAKDVYLDDGRGVLDVSKSNASELHVSRDSINLVNEYDLETDPIGWEVSIVLAMGFTPVLGDESDANRKQWLLSAVALASSEDRKKYREYVADEAGDGHYDLDTDAFVEGAALDLSSVFGEQDEEGQPKYVARLRPGERILFSKDAAGLPRRASLSLSRDYAGSSPAVWDGTGHWQPITSGWELLKDRLGIRVTIEDPEEWGIGDFKGSNEQNPGKSLRGVTSQANPSPSQQATQQFFLRLTAVIDADHMLDGSAKKRDASPTKYPRTRRIDAKDHFAGQVVHRSSEFNDTGGDDVTMRDDTEKAQAHAQALRSANEFPRMEGSIVIPWLTNAYSLGDRIRKVVGRDVTFQANAGNEDSEAPRYPYIVGLDYDFAGEQQKTMLRYSDRTTGPQNA